MYTRHLLEINVLRLSSLVKIFVDCCPKPLARTCALTAFSPTSRHLGRPRLGSRHSAHHARSSYAKILRGLWEELVRTGGFGLGRFPPLSPHGCGFFFQSAQSSSHRDIVLLSWCARSELGIVGKRTSVRAFSAQKIGTSQEQNVAQTFFPKTWALCHRGACAHFFAFSGISLWPSMLGGGGGVDWIACMSPHTWMPGKGGVGQMTRGVLTR